MMVVFFCLNDDLPSTGDIVLHSISPQVLHLIKYAALIVDLGPFAGLPFIEETNGSQPGTEARTGSPNG
jgi:hypothetical protein